MERLDNIYWKKAFKKATQEKEIRNTIRKFLKFHLKGLSPSFRLEVKVLDRKERFLALLVPVHSEGNLIRVYQLDNLIEKLEDFGFKIEVLYQDDIWEKTSLT